MLKELERQRDNTYRCLNILIGCDTRAEILEGFSQIATLLRQANDPAAAAAEMAYAEGQGLPYEDVLILKLDFMKQFQAFLSSTEQTEQELAKAKTTKPVGNRKIVATLIVIGLVLCLCIVSVSIYLLYYSK